MHAPTCGIFCFHSVDVVSYAALIQEKYSTNYKHILQKAFFKHALELLPCYDERFVIFDKVINVICSKIEGDRWPNLF